MGREVYIGFKEREDIGLGEGVDWKRGNPER